MDTLLHYWQLFTQGARDNIVADKHAFTALAGRFIVHQHAPGRMGIQDYGGDLRIVVQLEGGEGFAPI